MEGGKKIIMMTQTIYGNVPSKSNSYKIVTFNGHASLAKSQKLKQYENDFFIQCNHYRDKNIDGYFELYIDVFYNSQRLDLDNSLKIVLDCLQKVKAVKNDNKLVKIVARKFKDVANPRIEFTIEGV